jgi:hypothetical protein
VVGGRLEEGSHLNTAEIFEWSSKRWWTLPKLERARSGCAVASLDKALYVFGGMGEQPDDGASSSSLGGPSSPPSLSVSTSCEVMVLGGKSWMTEPTPMPQARCFGSAVSFPLHSSIVLLGGRDPMSWMELRSVDAYHTETKVWTTLPSMSRPRFGCGATRISLSNLLVVGGSDGNEWTTSCEMYDHMEGSWKSISDMPLAMQFCTATTLNEDYVVVSGQALEDDGCEEPSVAPPPLVYQISQDLWTVLESSTNPEADVTGGAVMMAVNRNCLVALGGTDPEGMPTKITRTTTNLMSVLKSVRSGGAPESPPKKSARDSPCDLTLASFKSPSSYSRKSKSSRSIVAPLEDDDIVPWWVSPQKAKLLHGSNDASPMSGFHCSSSSRRNLDLTGGLIDHISLCEAAGEIVSGDGLGCSGHISAPGRAVDDMSTFTDYSASYPEAIAVSDGGSTILSDGSGTWKSPTRLSSPRKNSRRGVVDSVDLTDANGVAVVYTGGILDGRPHGKGWMVYENGDTYAGSFRQGRRHGRGCQSFRDGRQYEGRFASDLAEDPCGQMTWKDGAIYVGTFTGGERTGQGVQRFPSAVRYEGSFLRGKYSGYGVCVFADGTMYDGAWVQGKAHGHGKLIGPDGRVLHNGLWEDDSPVLSQHPV